MKKRTFLLLLILFSALCLLGVIGLYYWGRPARIEMREEIYPCVVYYRKVHASPRTFVAHIVTVDLTCKNIEAFVTPAEKNDRKTPLRARTTSQFSREFGVQVAINGDGFSPWVSKNIFQYYPHVGDPVAPNGYAVSRARSYGENRGQTLYISSKNVATFGPNYRNAYNAISGQSWLVKNKQPVEDLNDTRTAPRTAIGLDGPGTRIIMIVVDGRQPFYSNGVTIQEMAELMLFYGGDNAINLDGGGSSTLVIQDPQTGAYKVMNSPVDNGIPGRERPVGNHFGIFVK